jgi:hypothetical protein
MGFCAMDSSSLAEKKKGKWSKGPQTTRDMAGRSSSPRTYPQATLVGGGGFFERAAEHCVIESSHPNATAGLIDLRCL